MTPNKVRSRVRSTVSPGATQVMVKITGGVRGMKATAAHFRCIGRQGKEEVGGKGKTLEIEGERGEKIQGRKGLLQRRAGGNSPACGRRSGPARALAARADAIIKAWERIARALAGTKTRLT